MNPVTRKRACSTGYAFHAAYGPSDAEVEQVLRMQLVATIEDPAVIQRILAHLGPSGTRDGPPPPSSMTELGTEQPALPGVTA